MKNNYLSALLAALVIVAIPAATWASSPGSMSSEECEARGGVRNSAVHDASSFGNQNQLSQCPQGNGKAIGMIVGLLNPEFCCRDYPDASALQAAREGDLVSLQKELKQEASALVRQQTAQRALLEAAYDGRKLIVLELLKQGASPNWAHGATDAIRSAVLGLKSDVVKILMDAGATISLRKTPEDPETVLYWASLKGDWKTVELLLSHGANPNDKGNGNRPTSPLSVALSGGKSIESRRGTKADYLRCARLLLKAGSNPNEIVGAGQFGDTKYPGNPLLASVAARQDLVTVKILLEYGADPDFKGPGTESAMDVACKEGDQPMISLLSKKNKTKCPPPTPISENFKKDVASRFKRLISPLLSMLLSSQALG